MIKLILSLSFLSFAEVTPQPSLDKIEILLIKEKWAEAVGELKDVPSGARDKRYFQYVEKAATGYLQKEASSLSDGEKLAESLPRTFPSLAKSEVFQAERDSITKRGFNKCFEVSSNDEQCILRLYARVEKEPERVEFVLWAANQLYAHKKPDLGYKALRLGSQSKRWPELQNKLGREIANQKDEGFVKNACTILSEKKVPHSKCQPKK